MATSVYRFVLAGMVIGLGMSDKRRNMGDCAKSNDCLYFHV